MKKELFAAILLAALFFGALVNIRVLDSLGESITAIVDDAERAARSHDLDGAAQAAEDATRLWESRSGYTHLVLRHSVIEDVSDKLGDLAKAAYAGNPGETVGAAKAARSRIESMASIERVRAGSIF
ncbi:MAG: DUF4363 family protein [Oscillospiraceae bacterium]|jgi:hypothetical protein|nr:DUF4363 family protein [Oscillospiraceae bacterium]